jgi:O-antigen/teichoic acid export membrane protein
VLYLLLARHWPAWLAGLTVLWLILVNLESVVQWSGVAAQRFRSLAIANVINRSTPIMTVLLFLAFGARVRSGALVVGPLLGMAVSSLVLLYSLRSLMGLVRPDRTLLGAMWRYALPTLVGGPAITAVVYADPLILDRWVSHADVGRYQLAYAVINAFGMLGGALNSVHSPELVRAAADGDTSAIDTYRARDQPRYAILLGVAAFGAACLAPSAVRTILPARFAAAGDLVGILTVAGGLMLGVCSLHPLATVTDSTWAVHLSYAAGAITNVVLDLIYAPIAGVVGVALANVAAWLVHLVLITFLLRRRVRARLLPLLVLAPCSGGVLLLLLSGPSRLRYVVSCALLAASAVAYIKWRIAAAAPSAVRAQASPRYAVTRESASGTAP